MSAGLSFWQRSASARRRLVLLSLAFALVSLLAFVHALLAFPFVLVKLPKSKCVGPQNEDFKVEMFWAHR